VFQLTPLLSLLGVQTDVVEHEENKQYFDFWFEGFAPLPLAADADQDGFAEGAVEINAAHNHFIPRQDHPSENLDSVFIAGIDYGARWSDPNSVHYIASPTARADAILAAGGWEKLYDVDEGRGFINRSFEGIPTRTLWEPEDLGGARGIRSYTLDDGTELFLRVPQTWWDKYDVTALGDSRPPEDDVKKLQYVGNVYTYDERVGEYRTRADLNYQQSWTTQTVQSQPSNPVDGQRYDVSDNDNAQSRWVVTLVPGTGVEQFSIRDGREASSVSLPYVATLHTGLVQLTLGNLFSTLGATSSGFAMEALLAQQFALQSEFLFGGMVTPVTEQLIQLLAINSDNSVTRAKEPEWNMGPAGSVSFDGHVVYEDLNHVLNQLHINDIIEATAAELHNGLGDAPTLPLAPFMGNNWLAGVDRNGRRVYAQHEPGSETNILPVANAASLELLSSSTRFRGGVGTDSEYEGPEYYHTNLLYTYQQARNLAAGWGAPGETWRLVSINSAAENNLVRGMLGGESAWIGDYDVLGTTSGWSFRWEDGTLVTSGNSQYRNFAGGEPNDLNDEDHLQMWTTGQWNDLDETAMLHAVLEKVPDWSDPFAVGETLTDYRYRMTSPWEAIEDVRSDITYLAFTEAHDILDSRPRYETVESLVPMIKMEQVTN